MSPKRLPRSHSEATGADHFFAQVIFQDIDPRNMFLGGTRITEAQLFVHGHIRARSAEIKARLIASLLDSVTASSGFPSRFVWVYVSELPPSFMVEFGQILPEPGDEESWKRSLSPDDRAYMNGTEFE